MKILLFAALLCANANAQTIQSQSASSITFKTVKDAATISIRNVTFEVTSANLPGRLPQQRLVLRTTTDTKQIIGDMGTEATTTLEAWPFPSDLKQKPLYKLSVSGINGHIHDYVLYVISRALEEVEWWSVYKLGTAQHLFDSHTPLVDFSISQETRTQRYAGLEVPPGESPANLIAIIHYASEEGVIRRATLTHDDPQQARLLRSYADSTRTLSLLDSPQQTLKIAISQSYPSPPATVTIQIPILHDDLDLAHAKLPAKFHLRTLERLRK